MTMSSYHLSLQRYDSVEVTIIFYKRAFDYTGISNVDGVNHRGRKSEELRLSPARLCDPGVNISGPQFVHLQSGDPTATSTHTPVYSLPVLERTV